MPHLDETGAQSIGLFRTELQFMLAPALSRGLARRKQLYRSMLDAAGDRPVTFRTLDIGGDKVLPYMKGFEEENPALGWRAIRIGLDRPALLRMQLRALIRAAAGRDLKVMLPMVSSVDELRAARAMFDRELAWNASRGHEPPRTVEARGDGRGPVAALAARRDRRRRPTFCRSARTICMQYLYAVDRDNRRVADRFER